MRCGVYALWKKSMPARLECDTIEVPAAREGSILIAIDTNNFSEPNYVFIAMQLFGKKEGSMD